MGNHYKPKASEDGTSIKKRKTSIKPQLGSRVELKLNPNALKYRRDTVANLDLSVPWIIYGSSNKYFNAKHPTDKESRFVRLARTGNLPLAALHWILAR